jgi:hypothetical protein
MKKEYNPVCCGQESVRNEVLGKSFNYCRVCQHETSDYSHEAQMRRMELEKERNLVPEQRYGYRPTTPKAVATEVFAEGKLTTAEWDALDYQDDLFSPWIDSNAFVSFDDSLAHWYANWKEYE